MRNLVLITIAILSFGFTAFPAQPTFTSLYVFGDALSSTTDNPQTGTLYYGKRYSNGRIWVEVLAQRQGLTYDASKNNSYYDHNSAEVVGDVNSFNAPLNVVTNALFIVWVCNADTFDAAYAHDNAAQWNTAISQSQTNHLKIITALYDKGVRTLIMPNAVDISKIPAYNSSNFTNVMHNGCTAYNVAFSNTISQAKASCHGLQIYSPDYFALLNNVLTNAAYYGLTNTLSSSGFSIDATDLPKNFPPAATNGFGTNFVFWDNMDPTAKLHEIMADVAQQIISPVQISRIAVLNGSNQLDVVNVPVGLNGFVDGLTNLAPANWTSVTNITSTNIAQSFFVAAPQLSFLQGGPTGDTIGFGGSGSNPGTNYTYYEAQYYRLRFPCAWTWP